MMKTDCILKKTIFKIVTLFVLVMSISIGVMNCKPPEKGDADSSNTLVWDSGNWDTDNWD